ncbi:ferritin family protein [Pseudodesulfovibrio sp. zrk46]|uniref:ferritin-like domain-containing protein n=1 Tax=Pseudodesulfovibrio sp. zrk46 TaxID=2725288 RepID=UPI001448DB74|nr:ferritin family protein [Pseudodesulfovibrio sp. zrk46]QJB57429.1 ferritin family protein [Pseudodesulfovibrio sp. zrk46]
MAFFFHANEIAKSAVEIERKGRAFYLRLAESAQSEKSRELFEYLAAEEAKHEEIFASLQTKLGDIELPAWATQHEYMTYIQGIIESHTLFTDDVVDKQMAVLKDEKEAIRMAIGFEKDTMLFFTEMKELVPQSDRDAVKKCIDEERLHLSRLQTMLKAL